KSLVGIIRIAQHGHLHILPLYLHIHFRTDSTVRKVNLYTSGRRQPFLSFILNLIYQDHILSGGPFYTTRLLIFGASLIRSIGAGRKSEQKQQSECRYKILFHHHLIFLYLFTLFKIYYIIP